MLQASYIGCPNVVKEIADKMSNSKVQPPNKVEGTLILLSLKLEQHGKFDAHKVGSSGKSRRSMGCWRSWSKDF